MPAFGIARKLPRIPGQIKQHQQYEALPRQPESKRVFSGKQRGQDVCGDTKPLVTIHKAEFNPDFEAGQLQQVNRPRAISGAAVGRYQPNYQIQRSNASTLGQILKQELPQRYPLKPVQQAKREQNVEENVDVVTQYRPTPNSPVQQSELQDTINPRAQNSQHAAAELQATINPRQQAQQIATTVMPQSYPTAQPVQQVTSLTSSFKNRNYQDNISACLGGTIYDRPPVIQRTTQRLTSNNIYDANFTINSQGDASKVEQPERQQHQIPTSHLPGIAKSPNQLASNLVIQGKNAPMAYAAPPSRVESQLNVEQSGLQESQLVDSQMQKSGRDINRFKVFGGTSIIGRRQTNEDSEILLARNNLRIFAVFDGHGGSECAHFCEGAFMQVFDDIYKPGMDYQKALFQTFIDVDRAFVLGSRLEFVGCTATVCLLDLDKNLCITANAGDSQVLLGFSNNYFVTRPHKPNDELEIARLKRDFPQTQVLNVMGVWRLDGMLSLSRAIGDFYMKHVGITPEPDIEIFENISELEYVVACCDGVYDVFEPSELDDIIRTLINNKVTNNNKTRDQILQAALFIFRGDDQQAKIQLKNLICEYNISTYHYEDVSANQSVPKRMSQTVTKLAYLIGSMDNITCVVSLK